MSEVSKSFVIALRDKKAESVVSVCSVRNEKVALRLFEDLLSDKGSMFGQHPEDFELLLICSYDSDSGVLVEDRSYPCKIADGMSFKCEKED